MDAHTQNTICLLATAALLCSFATPTRNGHQVGNFPPPASKENIYLAPAGKVTVCHKGKNLEVNANALNGHLGHGDTLGGCATPRPTGTAAVTPTEEPTATTTVVPTDTPSPTNEDNYEFSVVTRGLSTKLYKPE